MSNVAVRLSVLVPLLLARPVLAQETILLRPEDKNHVKELVEDRGKPGAPDRAVSQVAQPSITVYLPPKDKATGAAVIVCPGGGYQRLAIDKEGHEVARWLSSVGVAGIVLKYRLPGQEGMQLAKGPVPQATAAAHVAVEDAEEAVRQVRAAAGKWHLRPDAIGMMGFSAGGNLAALVGLTAAPASKPSFLILVYPSLPRLPEPLPALPPTFVAHAIDDKTVDVNLSLGLFTALHQAGGADAELHLYATGGHGFGMRKSEKTAASWPSALAPWLAHVTAARK